MGPEPGCEYAHAGECLLEKDDEACDTVLPASSRQFKRGRRSL